MDERNQTPYITFGNTRAEILRFGGAGFNIVRVSGLNMSSIYCRSIVNIANKAAYQRSGSFFQLIVWCVCSQASCFVMCLQTVFCSCSITETNSGKPLSRLTYTLCDHVCIYTGDNPILFNNINSQRFWIFNRTGNVLSHPLSDRSFWREWFQHLRRRPTSKQFGMFFSDGKLELFSRVIWGLNG